MTRALTSENFCQAISRSDSLKKADKNLKDWIVFRSLFSLARSNSLSLARSRARALSLALRLSLSLSLSLSRALSRALSLALSPVGSFARTSAL